MKDFEHYLGIANHDILMAHNQNELKSYIASLLCDYDRLLQENTDLRIQVSAREEEYRKLEDNWNELKKWLKGYLKLFNNPDCFEEQSIEDLNEVLNKMQELEKGKSE